MTKEKIRKILENIKDGKISVDSALEELKNFPFLELGYATLDTHRELRRGFPEVIFGQGKKDEQILDILKNLLKTEVNILITKIKKKTFAKIREEFSFFKPHYSEVAKSVTIIQKPIKNQGRGKIFILTAGTGDIPVAEEAAITATMMGNMIEKSYDVGVSGIHRLLDKKDEILSANVIIAVAGMEGALPSIVAGLTAVPVIAVPTSAGYGANFGGISPLLTMLNNCAGGIAVVNIDNGFGAGFMAALINRKRFPQDWTENSTADETTQTALYIPEDLIETMKNEK